MYNNLYIVDNTKNTFSEEFFSNTFITAIFDDVCNIVAFWPTLDHSFVPLSPSRKKQPCIIELERFCIYKNIVERMFYFSYVM